MTLKLSAEHETYVAKLVDDGFYDSPDAVSAAALKALAEKLEYERKRAELRAEIQKGLDDIAAGRFTRFSSVEEMMASFAVRRAEASVA